MAEATAPTTRPASSGGIGEVLASAETLEQLLSRLERSLGPGPIEVWSCRECDASENRVARRARPARRRPRCPRCGALARLDYTIEREPSA